MDPMKKTRKVPTTPGGRSAIRVRAADACPVCGAAMSERRGRLRLPVNGEEIPVPGALHLRCPDCGEVVLRLTDARRLAEDAYAVQHPGTPDRRSIQSVAVHLMGLCVLLEGDGASRRLQPVLGRMPARRTLDLHWLTPPAPNGRLTVRDALDAGSGDEHAGVVEAWARDVWRAWRPHHATVREWLAARTDESLRARRIAFCTPQPLICAKFASTSSFGDCRRSRLMWK